MYIHMKIGLTPTIHMFKIDVMTFSNMFNLAII